MFHEIRIEQIHSKNRRSETMYAWTDLHRVQPLAPLRLVHVEFAAVAVAHDHVVQPARSRESSCQPHVRHRYDVMHERPT